MRKILAFLIAAAALITGISPAIAQAPAPVPALPDTERRTAYAISAATGPYAVNFAIFGTGTTYGSWIEVWLNGVMLTPVTQWTLSLTSGTLATAARPLTNAQVTLVSAGTGTLQIVGARRPSRTSQFNENQGVSARALNQAITDLVATNRETWDKINDVTGRAIVGAPGDTWAQLPTAATRALKYLCFDSAGAPAMCGDATSQVSLLPANNIWTGTNAFVKSVTVVPPDVGGQQNPVNYFSITSDNVDAGAGFILGTERRYLFGGSTVKGGRVAGYDFIANTAPTNASNPNRNYVATVSQTYTAVGDGGTNTSTGAKGGFFGSNPGLIVDTGATNVYDAASSEVDLTISTGASARYARNMSLVSFNAVRGAEIDAFLTMSGGTAHVGTKHGILFTDANRGTTENPFYSGSVLIGSYWQGSTPTIQDGIDLSGFTITGNAFKSANFLVNGAGQMAANLIISSTSVQSASLIVVGSSSGIITILPQAAAGTYNFNLPTTSGTAGQILTSGGGGGSPMTWTSSGTGSVTSVATTGPITGGTITTTGTIACATCVTSAAALTANSLMIGSGSQASAVTTTGAGILTWLGTPSSANLAAAMTDETGTGALVFANTPTLVTPVLGVATGTKLSLTNSAGTTGNQGLNVVVTQTQPNPTDTADSAIGITYILTAASATNELASRIINYGITNNLTGGGQITNMRGMNISTNTNASTITGSLEHIYLEANTIAGTVTTGFGLRINSLQGTTKWGIGDDSGSNWYNTGFIKTGVTVVGSLPSCAAGIRGARYFVTDSNAASYTAGIGAVVAAGGSTNVPVVCDGAAWRIGANDNTPERLRRMFG